MKNRVKVNTEVYTTSVADFISEVIIKKKVFFKKFVFDLLTLRCCRGNIS